MQGFNDQSRPPPLTYGCVCSGVSAPTLAARPLGWKTKFFSEIEKFPRAVLQHHYPDVPQHGDFTTIQKDLYGTVNALIGGTPCQSFSVAGKRLGLDDPRGNLALEYVALAARLDAEWLVFENVPGLLSSGRPKGEDFATFISAATGYEYRPPSSGWQNAGIAEGQSDRWGVAWCIRDAQYFGVAQRRRRLFVVGYRGDWRPAAAVLLEPESMRGDSAPSREKKKDVAPTLAARTKGGGGLGTDFDLDGGLRIAGTLEAAAGRSRGSGISPGRLVPHGFGGGNCSGPIDVAACLTAKGVRQDFEVETFVTHSLRGEGFDASEDGTGRGTPIIPAAFSCKVNGRGATGGAKPHFLTPSAVRRLTPTECERLQGMPDDFTRIPWNKKPAELCPDGPRYKAIGNSMAVPCIGWILKRLDHIHNAIHQMEEAA